MTIRGFLILALGLVLAGTAHAGEDTTTGAVSRVICQAVASKADTQGANYVPGVDVNGNPVVPADVHANGQLSYPTDALEIPMTRDLAQRLNLAGGTEMQAPIGVIKVSKGGKVSLNGQDITAQTLVYCGLGKQAVPAATPVQAAAPQTLEAPVQPATDSTSQNIAPAAAASAPSMPSAPAVPVAPANTLQAPQDAMPQAIPSAPPSEPTAEQLQSAPETTYPGELLEGGESREEGYR